MVSGKNFLFGIKQFFIPFTTVHALSLIIILSSIVFSDCFLNGFVLDDNRYITRIPTRFVDLISNEALPYKNPLEPFLSKSDAFNMGGQYRPLPALYFSLLYSMFTTTPFYYHVLSLIIHITDTFLLFFLLKRFFNRTLALFLSLVFLVHPLQVESVAWIAAADNPLFFLFGISALLLSVKDRVSLKRLIGLCCLLLLSLLTKETAVIFIFLMLLYRVIFHKSQKFFFVIGAAFTLASYAFIRFVLAGVYFGVFKAPLIGRVPFGVRLLTSPAAIFYYIKNFFYPSHLGIEQNWVVNTMDFPHFYFPLFIDILFFILLLFFGWIILRANKKEFPAYLFFLVWLVAGLIAHSQLIPLDATVADRWMYFPIVGLLGVVGASIQALSFTSKKSAVFGFILGIILISLLSIRTIIRNTNWSDELTILSHDVHIDDITAQEGWFGQEK